ELLTTPERYPALLGAETVAFRAKLPTFNDLPPMAVARLVGVQTVLVQPVGAVPAAVQIDSPPVVAAAVGKPTTPPTQAYTVGEYVAGLVHPGGAGKKLTTAALPGV